MERSERGGERERKRERRGRSVLFVSDVTDERARESERERARERERERVKDRDKER